jgi:hypothetical protein
MKMPTQKLCVLLLLTGELLAAQDLSSITREIGRLADPTANRADMDSAIGDIAGSLYKVLVRKADTTIETERGAIQTILAFRRTDIQSGGSGGGTGSTSAVESPLLPAIFGLAYENGSITRTVSGSTVTLKANPAGLFCASGGNAAAVARRDDEACRTFWKRVGLTASFDTSRGDKSDQLQGLKSLNSKFAEFTARMELINHRILTRARYSSVFRDALEKSRAIEAKYANANSLTQLELIQKNVVPRVQSDLVSLTRTDGWAALNQDSRRQLIEQRLTAILADANLDTLTVNRERRAWKEALEANQALMNVVANSAVLTAEYSYQQPDLATEDIGTTVPTGVRPPNLHTARLIFAHGWGGTRVDFTANASASWFQEVRPGMSGLLRDIRVGGEAKFKLREIKNYGVPTLSFAGLYVYLHQRPLGLGITSFNDATIDQPGSMGVFQTKLEFPTANNGIRVPVSFTYSNRTELIKESDVRGQVGISFNLDSLFDKD